MPAAELEIVTLNYIIVYILLILVVLHWNT